MADDDDWGMAESWLVEVILQRRIAQDLRKEADMYTQRLRDPEVPEQDTAALLLARSHCIIQAAKIERHLRELD